MRISMEKHDKTDISMSEPTLDQSVKGLEASEVDENCAAIESMTSYSEKLLDNVSTTDDKSEQVEIRK